MISGTWLFMITLVLGCGLGDSYKLLVIFSFPGKSHGILGEGYVRTLVKAGHQVTYIAAVPMEDPPPGVKQIDVSDNFKVYPTETIFNIKVILNHKMDFSQAHYFFSLPVDVNNATIQNDEVQKMMRDPSVQFDAVIAEWMYSDAYSGFAPVFGCPLIWSSSMEPHAMVLWLIDEAPNHSYVPDHFSQANTPFTFLERVAELGLVNFMKFIRWRVQDRESEIYINGFGPAAAIRGNILPALDIAKYNGSLMLGNSHVSSGMAISLPQSYKHIGGYHVEEAKPLPKEWQKIMDDSKHGVIYFSLGSMVKGSQLPVEIRDSIVEVFRGLKQTVIWKFEADLPNLPANVHLVKWAPQQSVLAHPNCIPFITHGGLLSTTEALHFGVPFVGIPVFGDQFTNINKAVNKGFAKLVPLGYDIGGNLKVAIQEILENPKYRETMKQLSFVYHHRPATPRQELVHWVEHVIQTGGAPHLRSPALDVPFYQKMYLDLAALIISVALFLKYVAQFLIKTYCIRKVDANKKNR